MVDVNMYYTNIAQQPCCRRKAVSDINLLGDRQILYNRVFEFTDRSIARLRLQSEYANALLR